MQKGKIKLMILLHMLILLYSFCPVCLKVASGCKFLSGKFVLFYGLMLMDMFIYAIFWQKILKKMPMVTAFANKAVGVIWGLIWGVLLFNEYISVCNIVGTVVIIIGVFMVVKADDR